MVCVTKPNGNSKTEISLAHSRWPRTLAGFRAYLPCNRLISSAGTYSGSPGEEQQAWRYCDRKGVWAEDDYTRCQFQKDVTRFLHVINQVCNLLSSSHLVLLVPLHSNHVKTDTH